MQLIILVLNPLECNETTVEVSAWISNTMKTIDVIIYAYPSQG